MTARCDSGALVPPGLPLDYLGLLLQAQGGVPISFQTSHLLVGAHENSSYSPEEDITELVPDLIIDARNKMQERRIVHTLPIAPWFEDKIFVLPESNTGERSIQTSNGRAVVGTMQMMEA